MASAPVLRTAGVLAKATGRHSLSSPAKHILIHLPHSIFPLSSIYLRREKPFSPIQAQQIEVRESETQISDWEGDGENLVLDEVAGWDDAEFNASPMIERESPFKLFVGNVPFDMDSEMLAQLFQEAGVVEIAEVIYNRETDQSRGFGFVTMSSVDEVENAIEKFNGLNIEGRMLTVKKAAPKGSRQERRGSEKIYIGNLPWSVDEARLREVFTEFGKVVDSKVIYDRESGRSRGFGFISMSSKQEMDNAIASLDGQNLDGRTIRVNASEEKPRRRAF